MQSPIRLFLVGLLLLAASSAIAGEKAYWVFFKDKGLNDPIALNSSLDIAESHLTKHAKIRRTRLGSDRLVTMNDLPVNSTYISRLQSFDGVNIRYVSRLLNAVSINVSPASLQNVSTLPFVGRVIPVALRHVELEPDVALPAPADNPMPHRDHDFDYGSSLTQNRFMNVPELHDRGYQGEGIWIGVCDAGFDNLGHRCFNEINIIDAWDFVNDDANVADEEDRGSGLHGTRTLSILAGIDEGHLIGTAPRASYVLAKTEDTDWENPVEEDYWVAGVEWMDSLGVDVISSSVGYIDWYDYEDLDGETGVTTIVANRAIEAGIVIVNSIGNSGFGRYPTEKMITPADGFDVLAIGATNRDSSLAGFSSHGPTFDGRIKPDLVTFGTTVIVASSNNDSGYAAGAGTSYSAPAVAGLCALLLQASPYLTPISLKELLHNSADNSNEPDTLYGWGIPDGLAALGQLVPRDVQLIIPLRRGWNTISLNIANLALREFSEYLAPLVENGSLILAKDEAGRFYIPRIPFNGIPNWKLSTGYQIEMNQADTLRFDGEAIEYTEPIPLSQGWHIVAYYPNFDLRVETAMVSLTADNALDMFKDEWGRFFIPARNFSNMAPLTPGRGYHLKVNRDARLIYPRHHRIESFPEMPRSQTHYEIVEPGELGLPLLLLPIEGISAGDEAAFISEDGIVLTAGVFDEQACGITLWDYEKIDNLPRLEVWDSSDGCVSTAKIEIFEGNDRIKDSGYAVLGISCLMPQTEDLLVSIFPTPFNNRLDFSVNTKFNVPVAYGLYDITGRIVMSGYLAKGEISGSIDAERLSAGLYFLEVRTTEFRKSVRVVCLK